MHSDTGTNEPSEPASPSAPGTAGPAERTGCGILYPVIVGGLTLLAAPVSFLMAAGIGMASSNCPGKVAGAEKDPRLICTHLVAFLPLAGLVLAVVLFIVGGLWALINPGAQEKRVHWQFLLYGVLAFLIACGVGNAIATEPAP